MNFPEKCAEQYLYDPHGNVEWIVNDMPNLGKNHVRYEYDLVSNKVLKVHYNESAADEYHHRFTYDEDQRIKKAETAWGQGSPVSKNTRQHIGWDKDASYAYYRHGPLKRMEIGEDKIQGVDYVYTLQGWLKGINNVTTKYTDDPGSDNNSGNGFGDDVFGMVLGYHGDDFNRSSSKYNPSHANLISSSATNLSNLFNGNISSWTLKKDSIPGMANTLFRKGFKYRYDQLNRIRKEDYWKHSYAGGWADTIAYDSRYAYDANGNIDTLKRNAYGSSYRMDDFKYNYLAGTNKLSRVDDDPSITGNWAIDINDQSTDNYKYDAIGNLVEDVTESIDSIYWTVHGKMRGVLKNSGDSIGFLYDALGNRAQKFVKAGSDTTITYYIRDAQGNPLSVYERTTTGGNHVYKQIEVPMYGSDRLGLQRTNVVVKTVPMGGNCCGNSCSTCVPFTWTINVKKNNGYYGRAIDEKEYEFKDHLGNVHATVSDQKDASNYVRQVMYANYYAFGMEMVGKNYSSNSYRYGFNGQEKDDEVTGSSGSIYTATFWEYDARLGRRWNLDPKPTMPMSDYATFLNNPIWFNDPFGDTTDFYNKEGILIKHVEDGSNAKFQLTGNGWSDDYFKFTGYDETKGGKNEVNLQSVIDFTQDYTRENYKSTFNGYKKDEKGNIMMDKKGNPISLGWTTYCNFGTRCIANSVASGLDAMGIKLDVSAFKGSASDIFGTLAKSTFKTLTTAEAQKEAKSGSFVAGGWKSHALTLNKQGIINNVGAPREKNNLWDPQYNLPESNVFYLIYKPIISNK